jgi:hypothetical protein
LRKAARGDLGAAALLALLDLDCGEGRAGLRVPGLSLLVVLARRVDGAGGGALRPVPVIGGRPHAAALRGRVGEVLLAPVDPFLPADLAVAVLIDLLEQHFRVRRLRQGFCERLRTDARLAATDPRLLR